MSSPTVYLLCGYAFSGKSTLAAALAAHLDAAIVCCDEVLERRGLFGCDGVPDEDWARAHEVALTELDELMRRATPHIVVDDTSCFRFLRDDYREVARRHGYRSVLIVLDTPLEEIRRRRRANEMSPDRRAIADEVFDGHVRSFEWPEDDEPFVTFAPGTHVSAWIAASLRCPSATTDRQER